MKKSQLEFSWFWNMWIYFLFILGINLLTTFTVYIIAYVLYVCLCVCMCGGVVWCVCVCLCVECKAYEFSICECLTWIRWTFKTVVLHIQKIHVCTNQNKNVKKIVTIWMSSKPMRLHTYVECKFIEIYLFKKIIIIILLEIISYKTKAVTKNNIQFEVFGDIQNQKFTYLISECENNIQ